MISLLFIIMLITNFWTKKYTSINKEKESPLSYRNDNKLNQRSMHTNGSFPRHWGVSVIHSQTSSHRLFNPLSSISVCLPLLPRTHFHTTAYHPHTHSTAHLSWVWRTTAHHTLTQPRTLHTPRLCTPHVHSSPHPLFSFCSHHPSIHHLLIPPWCSTGTGARGGDSDSRNTRVYTRTHIL